MSERFRGIAAIGGPLQFMGGAGHLEFGSAGPITIGGAPQIRSTHVKASSGARRGRYKIAGYATRFCKPHVHKGGFEVFWTGAFAQTLLSGSPVRLLEDHDESKLLAATGGCGLKIWSDEVGLSFKAELPDDEAGARVHDAVKSGAKCQMSVGYEKTDFETKSIGGESVLLIRAARLNELSIVVAGAVKEAYAICLDRDDGEPYRESKSSADCIAAGNAVSAALYKTREFFARHRTLG